MAIEIVDLPMKSGDFIWSCKRLPEGKHFEIAAEFPVSSLPWAYIFDINILDQHFHRAAKYSLVSDLPYGQRLCNYGKSPCFNGKNLQFLWPFSIANP